MVDLSAFSASPIKKEHPAYYESFFKMKPAPEYASGEVLLASLYRNIGYEAISEKNVPSFGNAFFRIVQNPPKKFERRTNRISANAWHNIINGILKSPKQPNQSKARFLQITPLVPETSLYTSSARLRGDPWNPGALIKVSLGFASGQKADLKKLWESIYEALTVGNDDDIWARYIESELKSWRPSIVGTVGTEWKFIGLDDTYLIDREDAAILHSPSGRFAKDVSLILGLKRILSRRQWLSLFESILRVGTASHILWICHVHAIIWDCIKDALEGKMISKHDLSSQLGIPKYGFWQYGAKAAAIINRTVRDYYCARIGINLVLHVLEDHIGTLQQNSLRNVDAIIQVLHLLAKHANSLDHTLIRNIYTEILGNAPKELACRRGIPSNICEFLRYSLGQRQTSEDELRNYDQEYFLKKKSNKSPWVLEFGPVSTIALSHCCTSEASYPRTIVDLCQHLGQYGIILHANDVPLSQLGITLRHLGLIVDSPDAEGGMILVSPFKIING